MLNNFLYCHATPEKTALFSLFALIFVDKETDLWTSSHGVALQLSDPVLSKHNIFQLSAQIVGLFLHRNWRLIRQKYDIFGKKYSPYVNVWTAAGDVMNYTIAELCFSGGTDFLLVWCFKL